MPLGTIINVVGILLGGIIGKAWPQALTPQRESFFKVALGVFTVWYGLRLTWISVNGSALQILKQLTVAVVAMMLGKLVGRLCRLQAFSNHLGRQARERIAAAKPTNPNRAADGFKTCAELFCAAPLGLIGAVVDGLTRYFYPLAVKGVMDGLATMGFVSMFGWGSVLAAVPVLALQGSISLASARLLEPFLRSHQLLDPLHAVAGLIIFSVALVILGLKKIELTEYLPSLVIAPVLAWVFR
jgi:uncharacterized membrane protein YqgA involved in biofilm formation